MREKFKIEGKSIGDGSPTFLIAEISSNHNRNKNTVKKLINYAAESGFDAVKFQIYDAEEAFSKHEMTTDVGLDHIYGVRPWWEIARDKILMPRNWFGEMFDYVRKVGLIPLSAIHREEDCKFLLQFKLPAIKIASIDLISSGLPFKINVLPRTVIVVWYLFSIICKYWSLKPSIDSRCSLSSFIFFS